MKADTIKPLYIILALLSIVVIVQSYFLYDLKQGLETKSTHKTAVIAKPFKGDFFNNFKASRTDPFEQMQRMQEEMRQSFGHFNSIFADDPFFKEAFKTMSISPLSDIKETSDSYIVELSIPGSSQQNIKIVGENGRLSISASNEHVSDTNNSNYIHKERYSQHFERSFTLPKDADLTQMSNTYENGILKVTIAKKG